MTESLMPILDRRSPEIYYPFLTIFSGMAMLMLSGITGNTLTETVSKKYGPRQNPAYQRLQPVTIRAKSLLLLWKDIKIFFGNSGQWSQLFIIGALILIYIYNFRTLPIKTLADSFPFIKEFPGACQYADGRSCAFRGCREVSLFVNKP